MFLTSSSNSTSTHSNSRPTQSSSRHSSVYSNPSQASYVAERVLQPIPRHIVIDWLQLPDVFEAVVIEPKQTNEPAHFKKLREALEQEPLTPAEVCGDETHPPNTKLMDNFQRHAMQLLNWPLTQTRLGLADIARTDTRSTGSTWLNDDASSDSEDKFGIMPCSIL